jgi:hypothetical protein
MKSNFSTLILIVSFLLVHIVSSSQIGIADPGTTRFVYVQSLTLSWDSNVGCSEYENKENEVFLKK